jgi:hypothetical protein
MPVREPLISREVWHYECVSCLHEWREIFEIWHVPDGHGGEAVLYRHDGLSSTSPWTELMCPSCHGCSVRTFPGSTVVRRAAPPPRRSADVLDILLRLRRLHAY